MDDLEIGAQIVQLSIKTIGRQFTAKYSTTITLQLTFWSQLSLASSLKSLLLVEIPYGYCISAVNVKLTFIWLYNKQAYSIKNEMKKLKNEIRWMMNKSMKWSWFKVLLKVKQINEYLF